MNDEREQVTPETTREPEASAPRDAEANGAPTSPPDPEGLRATIEKLIAEKDALTDRLLRKQAELENFRKRTQREKEEYLHYATTDLIRALLPTLDAFDRALLHRSEGVSEQFYQGLELIHRELVEVLGRAGLSHFESVGKTFDPHLHQAVEMVEAGEHRDQEIVEELQRGYKLKQRLLRPAVVKVAVARAHGKSNPDEQGE